MAIINEAMAHYYFPGANPVGKYVTIDGENGPYEIVGIAGNAKYYEIRERTLRTVYLNTFQASRPASTFVLRTSVEPETLAPEVRRTIHIMLKNLAVARVRTLDDQVDATVIPERLIARLSGVFAAWVRCWRRSESMVCWPMRSRGAPRRSVFALRSERPAALFR